MSKISVIDNNSQQILKEFPMEMSEAAYQYATEMESYGLDVKIIKPNIVTNLGQALGLDELSQKQLDESANEELNDHEGIEDDSCCYQQSKSTN